MCYKLSNQKKRIQTKHRQIIKKNLKKGWEINKKI